MKPKKKKAAPAKAKKKKVRKSRLMTPEELWKLFPDKKDIRPFGIAFLQMNDVAEEFKTFFKEMAAVRARFDKLDRSFDLALLNPAMSEERKDKIREIGGPIIDYFDKAEAIGRKYAEVMANGNQALLDYLEIATKRKKPGDMMAIGKALAAYAKEVTVMMDRIKPLMDKIAHLVTKAEKEMDKDVN